MSATRLAYAVHRLARRPAGAKESQVIPSKSIVELPAAEYEEYLALGAVRAPTDDEAALWKLANPRSAAPVPAPSDNVVPNPAATPVGTSSDLAAPDDESPAEPPKRGRGRQKAAKAEAAEEAPADEAADESSDDDGAELI